MSSHKEAIRKFNIKENIWPYSRWQLLKTLFKNCSVCKSKIDSAHSGHHVHNINNPTQQATQKLMYHVHTINNPNQQATQTLLYHVHTINNPTQQATQKLLYHVNNNKKYL